MLHGSAIIQKGRLRKCVDCLMYNAKAVHKYSQSKKGKAAKKRVDAKRMLRKRLWQSYKMPLEEYQKRLQEQSNTCASCYEPERRLYKGRIRMLSVDHDHETGAIRGLLCYGCNSALGFLRDKSEYVEKLLRFIRAFEQRQEV